MRSGIPTKSLAAKKVSVRSLTALNLEVVSLACVLVAAETVPAVDLLAEPQLVLSAGSHTATQSHINTHTWH